MRDTKREMARLAIFVFLITTATMPWSQAQTNDQVTWAKRVESGKEVITTLQFYFHDILSGRNPCAIRIVQPPQTNNYSTLFGLLIMIDDPLTVGADPSSKIVGRARGMYGSAGQTDLGLSMVVSYEFTDGTYDGSSFSLLSINPAMTKPVREMAIVGGKGLFRLARGYAIVQTYKFDPTSGDAIVGYNVTLVTYI